MKHKINLYRLERSDQGTRGFLIADSNFYCYTMELPWRDNARSISCIPAGEYDVKIKVSAKYGKVYYIKEVPDRSHILIHSGNFAGDTSKDFKTHSKGCILLGQKKGYFSNQKAVLNSKLTIKKFMKYMNDEPFILKIYESLTGGTE